MAIKVTNRSKWTCSFLETFVLSLKVVRLHYAEKTMEFLHSCWTMDEEDTMEQLDVLTEIVQFVQNAIKAILIEQQETETSKMAKKELPFLIQIMEMLAEVECGDLNGGELPRKTSEFIEEIMKKGRVDEPKLIALVTEHLLRSARRFTDSFMSHAIEIASDLHFNFDDIATNAKIRVPGGGEEKDAHFFRMLADHGRCAESKSIDTLAVIADMMKKYYYELDLVIKRYQAMTGQCDDGKKRERLANHIVQQCFQWAMMNEGNF